MGDSTGSMFYAFLVFILLYVVGMILYQGYSFIKKRRGNRKSRHTDMKR